MLMKGLVGSEKHLPIVCEQNVFHAGIQIIESGLYGLIW